jgi:hypothetical protein
VSVHNAFWAFPMTVLFPNLLRTRPVCGELLILAQWEDEVQTCQRSRDG